MADDNKELLDLLEKLKKMEPSGEAKRIPEETSVPAVLEPASDMPTIGSSEKRKPGYRAESRKRPAVMTSELYKKISEIEQDIRSKEEDINIDLEKLEDLVRALNDREAELATREKSVMSKDLELSRQLDDMRKIKKELQAVLK